LDDDRGRADRRPVRGSSRRVGASARDRRVVRRSARLRVAQLDHVLAAVVLLLRPAEAELSRGLRVPWPRAESAAGATRRAVVEDEGGEPHADPSPRRGRSADHRLAGGGVSAVRRIDRDREEECPNGAKGDVSKEASGRQETHSSEEIEATTSVTSSQRPRRDDDVAAAEGTMVDQFQRAEQCA